MPLPTTDRPLSDEAASALIAAQFPELSPATVTGRREGMDHEALEIDGAWIFRFPKRAEYGPLLEVELALLPRLGPRLPVPVPEYRFVGEPGPLFPYVFAGYPKLVGTPAIELSLDLDRALALAPTLGATLAAVHAFPVEEARRIGVHESDDDPRGWANEALVELEEIRGVLNRAVFERCRDRLARKADAFVPCPGPPRLLHSDFSGDHLLLTDDGTRIVGLIDWTDASIGDPASEFSYLWVWQGEPLVREAVRAYGEVDAGFLDRVRSYGARLAIGDARYGILAGVEANRRLDLAALDRDFG